jgi:hypothetical protein
VLALCALAPQSARATQSASIAAAFAPERLGAPTTVSLGFRIAAEAGQVPSPLTGVDFRYPADLGIATSGLGTASCAIARLEADGPAICPADSRMGSGSAAVEIPVGGEVETETASLALLAAPSQGGYVRLLVVATGRSPVIARVLMSSLLLNGGLRLTVPLVESLPGAPDVSVVEARVTLGGDLTYYERRHGRTIAYHPPASCCPGAVPRAGSASRAPSASSTEPTPTPGQRSRVRTPAGLGASGLRLSVSSDWPPWPVPWGNR